MGISNMIKNFSRPALLTAALLTMAAAPAAAESVHGERSLGSSAGFYRDGYGNDGYYRPAGRSYDGGPYRHVTPRRHHGHRLGPSLRFDYRHGHVRAHRPFRPGRGIARRIFRHHGYGPRGFHGRGFRPYHDRRWR